MPDAVVSLARSIPVSLRREGYAAMACFAWAPSDDYADVARRAADFLHPEEQASLAALKIERRRSSYLLGRYAAKTALAGCIGPEFDAKGTLIVSGIFSQPVVQARTARPWGVGISHSDRLACGLAYPEEHPMAVDAEEIDPARTRVMATQIGDAEAGRAREACGGDFDLAATVVWTAKEALSKALRCGMTCPYELLETVEMTTDAEGCGGRFKNFGQYRFRSCRRGGTVVTIVLPKRTEMEFSLPELLCR
jgi:4'-phosphopantetheinyl transferase